MCICTHTYRQAAYHQLPVPSSLYKTQSSHPRTPLHSPQPTLKQVPQCSSFFLNTQFKEVNLVQGRGGKPKFRTCGRCPGCRVTTRPRCPPARPGPAPLPHYCTFASGLRFNNCALHSTDPVALSLQQNREYKPAEIGRAHV